MIEIKASGLPRTKYLTDKNGVMTEVADGNLRDAVAELDNRYMPVGITVRMKDPDFNPAEVWGGCWEYDETNHGLNGEYIYTKIANTAEELEGEEAA